MTKTQQEGRTEKRERDEEKREEDKAKGENGERQEEGRTTGMQLMLYDEI